MTATPKPVDADATADAPENWVVSPAYEGQNRRKRGRWFSFQNARLDDAPAPADPEGEPTQTLLRRVSLWTGLATADRDQRARYVATLEALARKGRREGHRHWPDIIDASARYVRAAGATGGIDEPLLTEALLAASHAHYENSDAARLRSFAARLRDACRGRF